MIRSFFHIYFKIKYLKIKLICILIKSSYEETVGRFHKNFRYEIYQCYVIEKIIVRN